MSQKITVDQAIRRGQVIVLFPKYFIGFGGWALTIFLDIYLDLPVGILYSGLFCSAILLILYSGFATTKWRIWAFSNVRNVHELKRKAIEKYLIWEEGSFLERFEIRSAADREKLEQIEIKFNSPDIFIDDYSILDETTIVYSERKAGFNIGFWTAVICFAIWLYFIDPKSLLMGVAYTLIALYIIFRSVKNLRNRNAQVILNERGIQTYNTPFYEWNKIYNDGVIGKKQNRGKANYLVYNSPSGLVELKMYGWDISRRELEKLLRVYRGRYEKL